jgi:hypothetical protein
MAGEQDDRQCGGDLRQTRHQLKAGIARHVDVRNQQIKLRRAEHLRGGCGVGCDFTFEPLPAQEKSRGYPKRFIVIRNEDSTPGLLLPTHDCGC